MTFPKTTKMDDFSIAALTGASQEVFPAAAWKEGIYERILCNPHATRTVWYAFDQAAAANAKGSLPLGPLETVTITTISQIQVIGTLNDPFTAYERKE